MSTSRNGFPSRIDVHAHYVGGTIGQMLAGTHLTGGFTVPSWTVDATLRFMDDHDIAAQILSVPFDVAGHGDPASARGLARRINLELRDVIDQHPDRFGAFAVVPLSDPEDAAAEIVFAHDELALDGIGITSNSQGRYLGHAWADTALATLAARQLPLFIHPVDPPHIDALGAGRPSSVFEFPVETARNILDAIYGGAFLRHPTLRVILPHAGGVLPTLSWRIREHLPLGRGSNDDPRVTDEHIDSVLQSLFYDTALSTHAVSLSPVLEIAPPTHLLFGSDFPAAPPVTLERADASFAAFRGLTEADKAAVGRNAETLFPRLAHA